MHQLYRIQFRVDAMPAHPSFYDVEESALTIFLFASQPEEAEAKARAFAALALWEVKELTCFGVAPPSYGAEDLPEWTRRVREEGFAFHVISMAIGFGATPAIDQSPPSVP